MGSIAIDWKSNVLAERDGPIILREFARPSKCVAREKAGPRINK